ncbi:MAG TPA: tetratricopeptide repeat protein [Methylomirabilota bacterium]|nr:tetratricopeptide repeat protein [Methylomirabilota bacterium]
MKYEFFNTILMGTRPRRAIWLFVSMALSACSLFSAAPDAIRRGEADRMVKEAEDQVRNGEYPAAARLFEEAIKRFPNSPAHDRALYGLARTLVIPDNGGRDYRQAHLYFDRLVREHPDSVYAPDARAWRGLLSVYLARTEETERLKQDIERLKKIDIEMERPRRR